MSLEQMLDEQLKLSKYQSNHFDEGVAFHEQIKIQRATAVGLLEAVLIVSAKKVRAQTA